MLTQTEDIVGRRKEHFEELLNPGNTSSGEEAESKASGEAPPMSLAAVAEVAKQLFRGKAPGVDEICPEMLKALDNVGLLWLTRLYNVAWGSGTVPMQWQIGVVVPIFKKGDQRVCSNYLGIALLSLPEEGLFQGAGKEALGDCRTSTSGGAMWIPSWLWNSGPALYPCRVVWGRGRGHGSLHIQSTCALWTWRRLMIMCPPGNPVGGTAGVWGTRAVGTCHSVPVQTK